MRYFFIIEISGGNFIYYISEYLKEVVHWKPVSEVSYALNTLSVSRCKSVQIGHWYRKFCNRKRRNSTIKSCIKIPILMQLASFLWSIRLQTQENCVWCLICKISPREISKQKQKSRVLKTYNCTWFLHIHTFKYFINWNSIPSLKKNLRN